MSCESWAGNADTPVRCRLPSCGHTVHLPAPVESSFACPTCGEERPKQSGPATRDYVPTANLTWKGATCQDTCSLHDTKQYEVRYYAFHALLSSMATTFDKSLLDVRTVEGATLRLARACFLSPMTNVWGPIVYLYSRDVCINMPLVRHKMGQVVC